MGIGDPTTCCLRGMLHNQGVTTNPSVGSGGFSGEGLGAVLELLETRLYIELFSRILQATAKFGTRSFKKVIEKHTRAAPGLKDMEKATHQLLYDGLGGLRSKV